MAGAVQVVLQTDLSTSHSLIPVPANDDSGAYLSGANQVLRATVTERANRISIETAITDSSTQEDRELSNLEGPVSSGILPLLNGLAKQIDQKASPFSTSNNRALQEYVAAVSSPKAQDRVTSLTDAISIDPSFGLAYIALADAEGQAAPQALSVLLQNASSHEAGFTPLDRARFMALLARYSHAPLEQQEAAFGVVLQTAPNQSDALIAAGSIAFLRGDASAGTRYLRRALDLNPGNVSVRRALADGFFETRRFSEAEKLLVGMDNNATVLPELAVCVLLEGDVARANTIAERLFATIPNPDAKTLFRAVWLKLSGQTQKAIELLTTASFAQPVARAIAYSELGMWQIMANDFAAARQSGGESSTTRSQSRVFREHRCDSCRCKWPSRCMATAGQCILPCRQSADEGTGLGLRSFSRRPLQRGSADLERHFAGERGRRSANPCDAGCLACSAGQSRPGAEDEC